MNFRKEEQKLKLSDLIFLKDLGQGQFGDVFLVANKLNTSKIFALKTVSRSKIAEHCIESNLVYEKRVLELINFPFIIRLYNTYKDKYAAHFLLNVIHGLDMFDMIR